MQSEHVGDKFNTGYTAAVKTNKEVKKKTKASSDTTAEHFYYIWLDFKEMWWNILTNKYKQKLMFF